MSAENEKDYDRIINPYPISFGWKTTMENKGFFVMFSIIIGLLYALSQYIEMTITSESNSEFNTEKLMAMVSTGLINAIITLGGANVCLKFYDGIKAELSDLYVAPKIILYYVLAGILYILLVGWPFAIVGGIIALLVSTQIITGFLFFLIIVALIIPAIVYCFFKAISYQFYPYVLIDYEVGPIKCLTYSRIIAKNHVMDILGLDFCLLLLNIAGALCLGIGLLFTIPTTFLALSHRYAFLRYLVEDELTRGDVNADVVMGADY